MGKLGSYGIGRGGGGGVRVKEGGLETVRMSINNRDGGKGGRERKREREGG